jgi:pyruvate formate lyase activating enzyme
MVKHKKAMYFNKIEDGKVHCYLCPHNCVIKPEALGACRARKNINGELFSMNYGEITSMALDPIEKKPLNRFYPGSMILSMGTFGCNLKCSFCQNWTIAHEDTQTVTITPREAVEKANELVDRGNIGIAYTYNEPSIWYEYVYETCKLAKGEGLKNVLVTNGFIGKEPLLELLPYVDAMNIDVKAYTAKFYNEICKATLNDVKETVRIASDKCHIELTTLVIPGLNDSIEEIEQLSKWVASISPDIPLHLSRYFPNYKLTHIPPTPKDTLIKAREKASEYLKFVYLGNI